MQVSNWLSIKSKLTTMMLAVSLGSIIAVGYLGCSSGGAMLKETVFNQLASIRSARAAQIEAYFHTMLPPTLCHSSPLPSIS